tara:strand:- start:174 stop:446 length:273 start_codon:yes stop_codon:yes gene_type:complete
MLIPVIQLYWTGAAYTLKEIYINPRKIIKMEEVSKKEGLRESLTNLNLHPSTSFTEIKISMNDHVEEIVVIGNPKIIESKYFKKKKLLKG